MECRKCGCEIESDDNFCPECGLWTTRGYMFFKDEKNIDIINGNVVKQNERMGTLFVLMAFGLLLFAGMSYIRGQDMLKPFAYIKKQLFSYTYGYETSLIKADNQYFNENINSLELAKSFIYKDIQNQNWQCDNNLDIYFIETSLQAKYDIASVKFCDISLDEVKKIENSIDKIYSLFPNIKGYLTNITITNANVKNNYIAYFQPIYQFVNSTNDITKYNRINKTQILLNSYYFANDDKLNTNIQDVVGEGFYPSDATWESAIAHEIGHYISFVTLLKQNNIDNVTLVNKDNLDIVNNILSIVNSGSYSSELLALAVDNYNSKYNTNLDNEKFAQNISKYAVSKNKKGILIPEETIAEAVHDYYLHGNLAKKESFEIINILNSRLYE